MVGFIDRWGAQIFGLLFALGTPLCGWVLWSLKNRFASKEDLAAVMRRLDAVEEKVGAMPSTEEIHKLSLNMERLRGDLRAIDERFRGFNETADRMQRQVDRMEDWLRGTKQ